MGFGRELIGRLLEGSEVDGVVVQLLVYDKLRNEVLGLFELLVVFVRLVGVIIFLSFEIIEYSFFVLVENFKLLCVIGSILYFRFNKF